MKLIDDKAGIKLYHEDCIVGMNEHLDPCSIDVVVTSPPYNIGVKYGSYDDKMPREEYLDWIKECGVGIKRILKDDGSFFLNIGSKPSDPTVPFEVLDVLSTEFKLQNVIHWVKSIYIANDSYGEKLNINVGHYKPINSRRFLNDAHEYIFHFTKRGDVKIDRLALGVPYKDKSNIERWSGGGNNYRCRGNCWFIPYKTIQRRDKDRPHPASFPPELAENCIRLHGFNKKTEVLDPFMGLGNTGLACQKLKIGFTGFEIDPYYFRTAEKSLVTK